MTSPSRTSTLLLLRFVQEGLTNMVRHANATGAELSVNVGAQRVDAVIEDSGRPDPSPTPISEGFGLRSLRSRAESLGGQLDATPTPNGFRLTITLPHTAPHTIIPVHPTRANAA